MGLGVNAMQFKWYKNDGNCLCFRVRVSLCLSRSHAGASGGAGLDPVVKEAQRAWRFALIPMNAPVMAAQTKRLARVMKLQTPLGALSFDLSKSMAMRRRRLFIATLHAARSAPSNTSQASLS